MLPTRNHNGNMNAVYWLIPIRPSGVNQVNQRFHMIFLRVLTKEGYAVHTTTDEGETVDEVYKARHFERKFFNDETNIAMAKALLDNGLYDTIATKLGVPLFGKTIVFCVSQKHASRITNILNRLAFEKWPQMYAEADFAMQVTSHVSDAQQMTINFANNS